MGRLAVLVGLVAAMVVPMGRPAAAQEAPSLTLTPATDLVDAQEVDLRVGLAERRHSCES